MQLNEIIEFGATFDGIITACMVDQQCYLRPVCRVLGLTQPVCDEGMPPEPMRRVKSHLRSLYQ